MGSVIVFPGVRQEPVAPLRLVQPLPPRPGRWRAVLAAGVLTASALVCLVSVQDGSGGARSEAGVTRPTVPYVAPAVAFRPPTPIELGLPATCPPETCSGSFFVPRV